MRHDPDVNRAFRPIAEYYSARLAGRGDLYGWGILSGPPTPKALLLADPEAAEHPQEIADIAVVVRRVERPEALGQ